MRGTKAKFARWVAREIAGRPVTQRIYEIVQVPTTRGYWVKETQADGTTTTYQKKTAIKVRLKPGCPREIYQRLKKDVPSFRAG